MELMNVKGLQSRTQNVPEFSFATVSESEFYDAVMSIRLDATGVVRIPFSVINCFCL
jgi:hypothetical protein